MSVWSMAVEEFERALLLRVLRGHGVNASGAAQELGIHRNTVSRLIKKHKISLVGIRRTLRPEKAPEPGPVAPKLPPQAAYVAARIERDPPISAQEQRELEGSERSAYLRKKPSQSANAMDQRIWKLAGRLK